MNTKTIAIHLTVPETQDPIELRDQLTERMAWPDRTAAQKRKAAREVEVESRNLARAAQAIEDLSRRLEQLETLTRDLLTRGEALKLADVQAREVATLKQAAGHLRDDIEELRTQWSNESKH